MTSVVTQASDTERNAAPAPASGGRGGQAPGNFIDPHPDVQPPGRRRAPQGHLADPNELVTYTIVSVVFVTFMVALVGLLDYVFTKLIFSAFG